MKRGHGAGTRAPLLLVVTASNVEVSGLHFDRIVAANVVVTGGPGEGVEGVLIHDNVLTQIDRNVPVAGITMTAGGGVSGYRVSNSWIRGNRLDDFHLAIVVLAIAVFRPAYRAAHVDPVAALKAD